MLRNSPDINAKVIKEFVNDYKYESYIYDTKVDDELNVWCKVLIYDDDDYYGFDYDYYWVLYDQIK